MSWKWILVFLVVIGIVGGGVWFVQKDSGFRIQNPITSVPEVKIDKDKRLVEEIRAMAATASGEWAIYVYRFDDGESYGINEREIMPAVSIMKLPALAAVSAKKDETWVLGKADISPGSGPLQFVKAGTAVTVERVMMELGRKSDNTAWVMINRRLGYAEMEKVVEEWGLKNSNYRDLTTTAEDVGIMMRKIYEKQDLWQYLEDSIYEDRISLGLPEGIKLVHKVGTDEGVWADAGILQCSMSNTQCSIKPFILVILNKEVEREEAVKVVPEITKMIWEYEAGHSKGG